MPDAYRPKLMLVDDDQEVHDTLKPFFTGMGCDVMGLFTAEEAWAALTVGKAVVDVIILDWDLPMGMSGPQLNKKLKSDENFKSLPVVFYTANWNPKVLSGSFMDWLSAVASMRNGAAGFDKDNVYDKKKKHSAPGPHPGLLLNVAQKLEETKKPVPAELAKMVALLKAEGFDATDEVLRMGHT